MIILQVYSIIVIGILLAAVFWNSITKEDGNSFVAFIMFLPILIYILIK